MMGIGVGDLRVVARESGRHRRIHSASVDAGGRVVFCASPAGAGPRSVILLSGAGREVSLASTGEEAPGGGRYRSFGELALDDDGSLLFVAEVEGGPRPRCLLLRTAGETRAIALAGDASPRGAAYATFRRPQIVSWPAEDGRRRRLAFVAGLTDGRSALVEWVPGAGSRALLATGDRVGEDVVLDFSPSGLAFGAWCVATLRGPGGGVFRGALFVDQGRAYWRDGFREGGEMGPVGAVARLLRPPAINVQMGVVAAGLEGGRTALCALPPALADPEAVLRTGDPLPGLPGETVCGIGPPVANGGVPPGGPFGVAAPARLGGRRTALWLGVFGGQVPLRGEAVVPLVSGDRTDDDLAASVAAFRPLQLTDSGVLLLRAEVGEPGAPMGALLVIDRLFDWYAR